MSRLACFAIALGLSGALVASSATAGLFGHRAHSLWRLKSRTDRFTGRTFCRLGSRDGRLLYQPGAVGLRLTPRVDTLDAWYRVDWGTPIRWRDRYPALVAAGVEVEGSSLTDPTDGIVWVPADELLGAHLVAVQIDPRRRYQAFRVDGLAAALASARAAGCRFDPGLPG